MCTKVVGELALKDSHFFLSFFFGFGRSLFF